MPANEEAVRRALLAVMFIGAASNDATPAQRLALQEEVLPVLQNPHFNAGDAMAQAILDTQSVMGAPWKPTGEWDDWILALLGRKTVEASNG